MTVDKHLPWHKDRWAQLWSQPSGLPHALLLAGPPGIGKSRFARALAQRLLCETASGAGTACGVCDSCRWFEGGNHPDFRYVIPEVDAATDGEPTEGAAEKKKASSQILIGQIRALEDFVYVGGHRGSRRVIVIEPAEAMNVPAANSLLKVLEEPPAGICFILVSSRWRRLLPTIRSRCRVLMFNRPGDAEARAWLTAQQAKDAAALLPITGGAPLTALEEQEKGRSGSLREITASLMNPPSDPMALAAAWESQLKKEGGAGTEELVATLQKWIFDLSSYRMTGRLRYFTDREREARALTGRADPQALLRCYGELLKIRALANHPLNSRLFLEDMAFRYQKAVAA